MSTAILHLRASNFVGGPERQVLSYAGAADPAEIKTWIGTFVGDKEGRDFVQAARDRRISVWECEAHGIRKCVRALKQFLRKEKIALVCTHGYKATIIATLACRPKNIPVVPFLRGWTGEDAKVQIYERLERALLSRCRRVVCLSETHAEELKQRWGWAPAKVRVVANASLNEVADDTDRAQARARLRERFGIEDHDLCVISAGRLSPEKGPFTLLQAARKIVREVPAAKLIIFGDGPLRHQLESFVKSSGLSERVMFAGFAKDLTSLLPGADLLINASHSEQMPNVIMEAVSAGIPVLATAVGGVPELLGDGAGCLVAPRDPDALSIAASDLLKSGHRREEIAAAARLRVQNLFSVTTQHRQLRALYSELLPFVRFERKELGHYPRISVVIPVRNEESHIGEVLDRLLEQEYPRDRFEILVADGHSDDRTREIVETLRHSSDVRIRIVDNPRRLSSAGRNAGVQQSTGEIVIFVDGHCFIPGRHLLYDTARLLQKYDADALARPQPLRAPGNNDFQDLIASVRESVLGHGRDSTIYSMTYSGPVDPTSSGATYKRSLFERVGYYDERFDACEDVEFNFRVKCSGHKCVIDPSLVVFYVPRKNLAGLFKQMLRYGKGRIALHKKHPDAFTVTQILPAELLLYFLSLPAAMLMPIRIAVVYSIPALAYVAAVLSSSISLAGSFGLIATAAPAIFVVIHIGLGVGWLTGLLTSLNKRQQRHKTSRAAVTGSGQ